MLYESYGLAGWCKQGLLLAAAIAAPLLCSNALMSGRPLPAFVELIGPRESRALIVAGADPGLRADRHDAGRNGNRARPRVRPARARFPVCRPDHGRRAASGPWRCSTAENRTHARSPRPVSPACFVTLPRSALSLNEGFHNWQSLWTSAAYVVLGAALWTPRSAVVWLSTARSSFPRLPGNEARAINRSPSFRRRNRTRRAGAPLASQRRARQEARVRQVSFAAGAAVQSPEVRPMSLNRLSRRDFARVAGSVALGLSAGSAQGPPDAAAGPASRVRRLSRAAFDGAPPRRPIRSRGPSTEDGRGPSIWDGFAHTPGTNCRSQQCGRRRTTITIATRTTSS